MPSVSPAQHRLMEAVDHGWHKPGGGGPSRAVAHEFVTADKGRSFASGGPVNKGYLGKSESFAAGGPVLGRTTDFMKTPDTFRGKLQPNPPNQSSDENWGKGAKGPKGDGGPAAPSGKDKSEKPVLPRK